MSLVLSINPPVAIKLKFSSGSKILRIVILALITSLLILYIFQVNFLTREVYSVESYENQLETLTQENKALEIDFSKVSSLSNIDDYLQNKNFVKASNVKYIKILASQVAAK